ncbi:MAG: dicarboxylate/amino acid:cation symporter [Cyanobacteria bacterium]|nr:dicarboxylate/amino acid:cation symporter [Cyanobacteriota bacterium]MDA1020922.1 dicarboxylate/amino acid:cation symporter [Cyanobacteriota bacterium]
MKLALHWRIFIGLILGAILGYVFSLNNLDGSDSNPAIGYLKLDHITWMGDLFLRLLKMIVIPVIVCSLVTGIGHLPMKSLGRIGILTLLTFKGQMLFAAFVGLFFVNLIKPGQYIDLHAILSKGTGEDIHFITEQSHSISEILLSMIPSNIFNSLSTGSLIQVIVFSIFLAVALVSVKNGDRILAYFKIGLDAILTMTHWIMGLAPFGVFALITNTVAIGGITAITKYGMFMFTVVVALMTMLFIIGSIVVHFFTNFTPLQFFGKMREVMLTAFSTSSSAATIPVTLETMEKEFGVPNRLASFVIPLGATMNMNGAAIYEAIVTLFVAQAWLPEPLSIGKQIFVVFMVLLATFGTPGIPHGSLVTIAVVFQAVGLPLEAIGVILSIDRILDMTRTMVNVSFDSISCLILDKYSGIEDEVIDTDKILNVEHA